jgi:hypothetical protein
VSNTYVFRPLWLFDEAKVGISHFHAEYSVPGESDL